MSDDDKKATQGTGEKATNGAAKATSAADEADTLRVRQGTEAPVRHKRAVRLNLQGGYDIRRQLRPRNT